MTTAIDSNGGMTAVRAGFSFDEPRLADWMTRNVAGFAGPMRVEQFQGGQSNPTYRLSAESGSYVLRRKPPGQLLKGAHDIEREARVLMALGSTGFPVARIHALCPDADVIGTPFFIMDMVDGRIFWDATIPGISADDRRLMFDAMNAAVARLHMIDYRSVGLEDFGRTGHYCERQIKRLSSQYFADADAGRDPHMDRLIEWLSDNIPADDASSLVHGDFRIDNIIFHPTRPEVLAVLDWELATLGHPLADFGYHAMMYRMPPHVVAGLVGAPLRDLNVPSEADYIAAYCRRTGRTDIADYDFYIAFNFFRVAAIIHGIKGRVIRGTASSQSAMDRIKALPELAELGWRQTR